MVGVDERRSVKERERRVFRRLVVLGGDIIAVVFLAVDGMGSG